MAQGVKTGGRKRGVGNYTTERVRSAIASFADCNAEKFGKWVEQVAENDPKEAAKLYLQAIEYHIPKLARTEMQALDKNGDPADNALKVEFVLSDKASDS